MITEEIWLKKVSEKLRPKKSGLRILLFSDFHVGGNHGRLMKLLNERTIHTARMVIFQRDYLRYNEDIYIRNQDSEKIVPMYCRQAKELIDSADFFHIGRNPINIPNPNPLVGQEEKPLVNWSDILKPENSLVQYWGSHCRNNKRTIMKIHLQTGIKAIVCPDYSMIEGAGESIYHIAKLFHSEGFPRVDQKARPVRISHCPTNRKMKATDLWLKVLDELKEEGIEFELDLIEWVPNEECLARRAKCHIHLDQINKVGFYGGSAIEGMVMGQVVLGSISNYTLGLYPSLPIVRVTDEDDLRKELKDLIGNQDRRRAIAAQGVSFVKRFHDPMMILKQYLSVYTVIREGLKNVGMSESIEQEIV